MAYMNKQDVRLIFGSNATGTCFRTLRVSLGTLYNHMEVGILKDEVRSLCQSGNGHNDMTIYENSIAVPEIALVKKRQSRNVSER